MLLDKGDRVDIRFHYKEMVPGMNGVYRAEFELEPAHVIEVSRHFVKVRFVREDILMVVEEKDINV